LFREKLPTDFIDKVLLTWSFTFGGGAILVQMLGGVIYRAVTGLSFDAVLGGAPAAVVANAFQAAFMPGLILTTCITAPVSEEIVFRLTCRRLFKNPVLFVLASSLLFGFIHTANFTTLGIVDYFVTGCLFAVFYLKTHDIRANIAAHVMYNTVLYVITLIRWLVSLFIAAA
jgi:membrane protease YdiL (CAAX protease family)